MAYEGTGDSRPLVISELYESCAGANAADEAALVGRLIGFACATEGRWDQLISPSLNIARLHEWVASGACLTAVTAMLGPDAGYMLSRAPGGAAMATVVVDGQDAEYSCFGETEAIALCGAISAGLAERLSLGGSGQGGLLH